MIEPRSEASRPTESAPVSPPAVVAPVERWRPPARPLGIAIAAVALLCLALGSWLVNSRYAALPVAAPAPGEPARREARLRRQLERLAPTGYYAVVDSYRNRLRVYRGSELVRDAICSTGSGLVLKDTQGSREWVFDTPRGERQVIRKTRDPVWIKPDWAFVEEGYLPPENAADRRDDVSLGDYGLYLGQGYLIHGTLFKSLLGRRVTHGCIRLGDEDLEFAYRKLPVGARVFLY
jgi:L,D-transpeptidase YbiS